MKTVLIAIIFTMLLVNAIHTQTEHSNFQNTIREMRTVQEKQDRTLAVIALRLAEMQKIRAEVTAYTLDSKEIGDDPQHAADMSRPVAGWTAAVSRDLIHLLGKKVYIPGHGVRVINDLTARGVTATVDLLVGNKTEARNIGREFREVIVL